MIVTALDVTSALLLCAAAQLVAFLLVRNYVADWPLLKPAPLITTLFSFCFLTTLLSVTAPYLLIQRLSFLFFGLTLVVTAYTDAQALLISRWCTIFLIPLVFIAAYNQWITTSLTMSIWGAVAGALVLWLAGVTAHHWTGTQALGQGDIDLLAYIGAVLGPLGCWQTLLIGSVIGSIVGIVYASIARSSLRSTILPFGTFLSIAAAITILLQLQAFKLPAWFDFLRF